MENSQIKKELNTIHAPEALLEATMAKMHEENAKQLHSPAQPDGLEFPELAAHYGKKKRSWLKAGSFGAVFVTAMAAVVIAVLNRSPQDTFWQVMDISQKPYYKAAESTPEHVIALEDFEARTEIPLLPYMTVNGYTDYVCYEEDGRCYARLHYSTGNCTLILADEGSGIASAADPSKYRETEGINVFFAKEKDTGMKACIWKDDLGEYSLSSYGEEEPLLELLKQIIVLQKGLK